MSLGITMSWLLVQLIDAIAVIPLQVSSRNTLPRNFRRETSQSSYLTDHAALLSTHVQVQEVVTKNDSTKIYVFEWRRAMLHGTQIIA